MRHVLIVAAVLCTCSSVFIFAKTSANDPDKARVFITDSQSWSIGGMSGGANGAGGARMAGGARPQTAEIIKTFGERCPQVVTNNKQDKADYIVVLDHEGGKSFVRHKNKVAVFNRVSGDSLVSKSTLSLGGSVEDACEAIKKDWSAHGADIRADEAAGSAATQPQLVPTSGQHMPPIMNDHAVQGATSPVSSSTAQLQVTSTPDGADIEIDGSFVGNTPSTVGVAAGQHDMVIKKSGFKPWERKITVSSGQVNVNAALEADGR